jgi:hypothetical protein
MAASTWKLMISHQTLGYLIFGATTREACQCKGELNAAFCDGFPQRFKVVFGRNEFH